MEALLAFRRQDLLGAYQLWRRQRPHQSKEKSMEEVIHALSLRPSPPSRSEIQSEQLVCEIFCDAMEFAHSKGFGDKDAAQFLYLFLKALDLCRKLPENEAEVPPQSHISTALASFKSELLPKWTTSISHPFSSLALEYVLSTAFTHFHLYRLVLNGAATVETDHVALTVPGPPVCEPLQQGTPQKEWELNEKMKELESEHQQRLHQLDTMEQPLKWDRLAVSDGLGKGGTAPSISSTIDAFTTQHVDSLAVDLARQVNLYKEQVEYKTRLTETLVHHKKEKAN